MTETEVISIDRHGQRKEYPSIKSAAEDVGVRPCQISTACVTAARDGGGLRRRIWMGEFPERLRKLRESMRPVRSMTVTSQLMGLHPDMLRRYERGEVEPSMDALYKIADYYGVSTDYLLGRTNFPFVHRV